MFVVSEITIPTEQVDLSKMGSEQVIEWLQATVFPSVIKKGEVWTTAPVIIKNNRWVTAPVKIMRNDFVTGECKHERPRKLNVRKFLADYEGYELTIPHIKKGKGLIGNWSFEIALNEQGEAELRFCVYRPN